MKRGGIVLRILVLVGVIALLGTAQLGYGKEKPGAVPGKVVPLKKCAVWKIKSITADKKCYEVPPTCDKEFIFLITAELEASPGSSPPGGLIIDATYKTCTYESGKMPPLDLSTAPSGIWIPWHTDTKVRVTRISSHRMRLDFSEYHVSCKCDGKTPVTITLTAHTMCGGREIGKDTKTLTVPPCPPKKCACWKIVKVEAKPACYTAPPPCTHTPMDKDFIFSFTVDLRADPKSLPPCDLVIDGSQKTCQYESEILPSLDLTGVSGLVTWGGATMEVKKLGSHHIQLYFPDCHVSCRCDGTTPVTGDMTARSVSGGWTMCKSTATLTVPPCK